MNKLGVYLVGGVTFIVAAILVPVMIFVCLSSSSSHCNSGDSSTGSSRSTGAVEVVDAKNYKPPETAPTPVAEAAARFVENVALDPSHGYSQPRRNGNPDFDCSSLVYFSVTQGAGIQLSVSYPFTTFNMGSVLEKAGYMHFHWSGNAKDAKNVLKRGDIIVNTQAHTETYLGGGLFGAARHAYPSGIDDGHAGDQGTGAKEEIIISPYLDPGLVDAYRYTGMQNVDLSTVSKFLHGVTDFIAGQCSTNDNQSDATKVSDVVPANLVHASAEDARAYAKSIMGQYGWNDDATDNGEFGCLVWLWNKESGWRWNAENKSSHAYGIPQSLPGSKMGSVKDDWKDNAGTQIVWGMQYIKNRYGSPCSAKSFHLQKHWY